MKPMRVFLIRNFTTALFMAAYYKQEKLKSNEFRDVCILHKDDTGDTFDPEKVKIDNVNKDPLFEFASMISGEMYEYPELSVDYMGLNFKRISYDKKIKQTELKRLSDLFEKNNIDIDNVVEVYHGNRILHQYLKYLNPKIKLIGFEHGLSDIRNHLFYGNLVRKIVNAFKRIIGGMFFFFYPYCDNDDLRVSLFAQRVKNINKNLRVCHLDNKEVNLVARDFAKGHDLRPGWFNNKKTALLILNNIERMTCDEEKQLSFYEELAGYISSKLVDLEEKVDTVVIAPRAFDDVFEKARAFFVDRFSKYETVFFDEVSDVSCPVECFLDEINPVVALGNTSSGLFYSKALRPQIKTYTFHEFVMEYLNDNFGWIFPDYKWILNLFYDKYKKEFQDILPDNI